MIKSVFELDGQTFESSGYLIEVNLEEGRYGTIQINHFDSLVLAKAEGRRIYFTTNGGTLWSGAQEPKEWNAAQRRLQPYLREDSRQHLQQEFAELVIKDTSDGSRFLSMYECWGGGFSSCITGEFGAIGAVADTLDEVDAYLKTILPRLGVPPVDVPRIKSDILQIIS